MSTPSKSLSILIPVYERDVRELVAELHRQGELSGIPFEILCFDDGSSKAIQELNAELEELEHVRYVPCSENKGRAAIRDLLGKEARYEYLLFMDCDPEVPSPEFLERYIERLSPGRVLYGGRGYQDEPPEDPSKRLHWSYGRKREMRTASERAAHPYHSFMTNNFTIPRELFLDIGFDQGLVRYGHEDTLFGMELRRRSTPILHFDNPLLHAGLEPAEDVLRKTREAVKNLVHLYKQGKPVQTRLIRLHEHPVVNSFRPLLRKVLLRGRSWMERQLRSKRPMLFLLDLYKLSYWLEYWQEDDQVT